MGVLVGKEAPNFTAAAVMSDNSINNSFNLKNYIKDKKAIVFFYPLDFTFVCPSELISLDKKIKELEEQRNTAVISVSIDSQFTHLAYKNTSTDKGGVGNLGFPMVADITGKIASEYGVLTSSGVALRATFLIDKNLIIRHQTVNDLPLGRNIDEIIRMVDALEHFEQHGEVCPANWNKGKEAIKPTTEGITDYLKKNASKL